MFTFSQMAPQQKPNEPQSSNLTTEKRNEATFSVDPNADVTFVSQYNDQRQSLLSGVCKAGMVEFLTTTKIYRLHNINISL